jgi:hypothetical protein
VLEFKDERFVGAFASLSDDTFGTFKDILIARYGKPHQTEVSPSSKGQSTAEELHWIGNRVSIRLSRNQTTSGRAIFRVALKTFLDQEANEQKARIKKAADALK